MSDSRYDHEEFDLYEDYDIRINRDYISLLVSEIKDNEGKIDHEKTLPIRAIKTFPTYDYLAKYQRNLITSPDVLPPGCRYVEKLSSGHSLVVIEEPPQFRTVAISWNFDMMFEEIKNRGSLEEYGLPADWLSSAKEGDYDRIGWYYKLNLAFPYVIFVIMIDKNYQVSGAYTFLRVKEMMGLSDYLLKMPLSNINDNQRICFGSRISSQSFDSVSAAARHAVNVFWTSVFNTDYTYNVKAYQDVAGISNYLEWQHLSRIDPMFIYRVDWVKMESNIQYYIDRMKGGDSSYKQQDVQGHKVYDEFINVFTKPVRIAEVTTGKIRKKIEGIYYDVTNAIYLSDFLRLEIGDSFTTESEKKYNVISFLGRKGAQPDYVRVSNAGRLINFRLTNKSRNFIKERVEAERYIPTVKIKDDLILQADDIIKYKNKAGIDVFKRVYYIRKSIDGKPEIRVGSQFFLANNFPKDIEKYNMNNPELYDMKLTKGDEFIYSRNSDGSTIISFIEACAFDAIDIGGNNSLVARFESLDPSRSGRSIIIDLNQTKNPSHIRRIFPKISKDHPTCEYGEFCSIGREVKSFRSYNNDGSDKPAVVYKDPAGYKIYSDTENTYPADSMYGKLIKNNKEFRIDTPLGVVSFEIGDLVVAANWKDPLSVLNIKRIEGFKTEGKSVYFILMDKTGKLSQELIIYDKIFRAGYIRKIVTKYEELESGTKIIAIESGFSNFPKKDINIIIGIIIDGPQPMVLCSNGCTLWYDDVIQSFKQIPMGTDEWNQQEHVPLDPKKIKFQAGDVVIPAYAEAGKEMGYLMVQNTESRSLKYIPLSTYISDQRHSIYPADKSFQDECILDSIPNPRITKAQQDKDGYVPAFYNFQGGVFTSENSQLLFVTDQRSFMNVPSSDQ